MKKSRLALNKGPVLHFQEQSGLNRQPSSQERANSNIKEGGVQSCGLMNGNGPGGLGFTNAKKGCGATQCVCQRSSVFKQSEDPNEKPLKWTTSLEIALHPGVAMINPTHRLPGTDPQSRGQLLVGHIPALILSKNHALRVEIVKQPDAAGTLRDREHRLPIRQRKSEILKHIGDFQIGTLEIGHLRNCPSSFPLDGVKGN